MARVPNYDDLAGFKTPTQRRTEGQVAQLWADMKRIDAIVANGTFEQLKALHVELDGTYQNRIKNWGTSMYNYIKDMGFTYEYIDDDSLRKNLTTMKGKLRGLLFDIDPNAVEPIEQTVPQQTLGEYRMNAKQRKLIADYAQIKQKTSGNMAITIQAEEYPRYKDTLDYMLEYEYITEIDVNFGSNHLYFKQPSFDSFAEIVMTQEMEEEPMTATAYNNKKVFIVHGHDAELKYKVSDWLRSIGLEPIILHLTANCGITTIINKIKTNSDVGCAIVLMTADDLGKAKAEENLKPRARQNVVFEAGYFLGKLGEERVILIYDEGIEAPGDLAGCVYIPADKYDGWKEQVRAEFRVMGIEYTA